MTRDWADSDYVRVYHTVIDDPKFADVYGDDRTFAWWVRLLITADQAFPASAPLPRRLPDDVLAKLVEVDLIRPATNDHYTVAGMRKEREARQSHQSRAGQARANGAVRNALGHFIQPAGPAPASSTSSQQSIAEHSKAINARESAQGKPTVEYAFDEERKDWIARRVS